MHSPDLLLLAATLAMARTDAENVARGLVEAEMLLKALLAEARAADPAAARQMPLPLPPVQAERMH